MQTSRVETYSHSTLYITLEVCVSRSRPHALGVEALIKHHAQVKRSIVKKHAVTLNVYLAHAGIALHFVYNMILRI